MKESQITKVSRVSLAVLDPTQHLKPKLSRNLTVKEVPEPLTDQKP
jgi:hypothetical protein